MWIEFTTVNNNPFLINSANIESVIPEDGREDVTRIIPVGVVNSNDCYIINEPYSIVRQKLLTTN